MSDDKAIEAFRLWYRLHTGKMLTRSNARKAVDSYLSAIGDSEAGAESSLRNVQRSAEPSPASGDVMSASPEAVRNSLDAQRATLTTLTENWDGYGASP